MNKKVMLLIPVLIGIMFVLPLLSATTILVTPATNGNYTKSLSFSLTGGNNPGQANNMTNVTCYYNASGGTAATFLIEMLNSSVSSTTFSGVGTLTSETETYNITCKVYNMTTLNSTLYASGITIDGTTPVTTLSLETENLQSRDSNLIQWTASDATSGLVSVVTTITSPDTGRCPTKTYTDTNGKYALTDDATACSGTYTVLVTATDYSGNIGTSTKTFKVSSSGLTKSGSNTLSGSQKSQFSQGQEINSNKPLGETGTNIAIIIILGVAIYLFVKRK